MKIKSKKFCNAIVTQNLLNFFFVFHLFIRCNLFIKKMCICLASATSYIRNTPYVVFPAGLLLVICKVRPRTFRVSAGSMIPSSHKRAVL